MREREYPVACASQHSVIKYHSRRIHIYTCVTFGGSTLSFPHPSLRCFLGISLRRVFKVLLWLFALIVLLQLEIYHDRHEEEAAIAVKLSIKNHYHSQSIVGAFQFHAYPTQH